jgi:hypothetical protein
VTTSAITPSGGSKGILHMGYEYVDSVPPGTLAASVSGYVNRLAARPWSSIVYETDILTGYPSATADTLTGFNSTANAKLIWSVEMT